MPIFLSIKRLSAKRVRARLSNDKCRSSMKKIIVRPRTTGLRSDFNREGWFPLRAAIWISSMELPLTTDSKKETGCGFPSTSNWNCSRSRPATKRPFLSNTVAFAWTSSVVTRTTSFGRSDAGFWILSCASVITAQAQSAAKAIARRWNAAKTISIMVQ